MEALIDQLKEVPGIRIEKCGTWLWITGNTYPVRSELKKLGCRFTHRKQCWYFHEGPYHKLGRRELSLDEIEMMYGSEVYDV